MLERLREDKYTIRLLIKDTLKALLLLFCAFLGDEVRYLSLQMRVNRDHEYDHHKSCSHGKVRGYLLCMLVTRHVIAVNCK